MISVLCILVVMASPQLALSGDFWDQVYRYTVSDVVPLNDNDTNETVDFGFVPNNGLIGDRVWNDSNKNGIQDEEEKEGIFGVRIKLYDANTTNGVCMKITTSNNTGYYNFTELPPGMYIVIAEDGFPLKFPNSIYDWGPSPVGIGEDLEKDSNNHSGAIVILNKDNRINTTIDFGYIPYK